MRSRSTIESRGNTSQRPQLIPYATFAKATKDSIAKALVPREPATIATRRRSARSAHARRGRREGSLLMQFDDGTAETALGAGTAGSARRREQAAVWINRFTRERCAHDPLDLGVLAADRRRRSRSDCRRTSSSTTTPTATAIRPTRCASARTCSCRSPSPARSQTYPTDFSMPAAATSTSASSTSGRSPAASRRACFPAALDESPSASMSYISSVDTPPVDVDQPRQQRADGHDLRRRAGFARRQLHDPRGSDRRRRRRCRARARR